MKGLIMTGEINNIFNRMFIMIRGMFLTSICSILFLESCYSQLDSTTNIIDNFVLVRSSEICLSVAEEREILVFSSAKPPKEVGTQFQILTRFGQLVKGSIIKTLKRDDCDYGFLTEDDISFGLLRVKEKVDWKKDEADGLVALESRLIQNKRVGKVLEINDGDLKSQCLAIIQPIFRDTTKVRLKRALLIVTPDSEGKFFFISVDTIASFDFEEPIGFLFSVNNDRPVLVLTESFLSNIFTISDLDNDGVFEILLYVSRISSGSFEVRLFDKNKFTDKKRILYRWMD